MRFIDLMNLSASRIVKTGSPHKSAMAWQIILYTEIQPIRVEE